MCEGFTLKPYPRDFENLDSSMFYPWPELHSFRHEDLSPDFKPPQKGSTFTL